MPKRSPRRSVLATSVLTLLASVAIGTGCAASEGEAVATTADALVMACGTTGRSSYGERMNSVPFSTGYIEEESEPACLATPCTPPTAAQWAAGTAQSRARGVQFCEDELARHSCPTGCKLTVAASCVVNDTREDGPLAGVGGAAGCTKNIMGKWQKDCRYAVAVFISGTASVTCGPKGSDPDAGSDASSDAGSGADSSTTSSSDAGGSTQSDAAK